jgi:hypothetical protein
VFEEVMYKAMVAKQLVEEDNRRVWKALLPVDLEVHSKWFQKTKKIVNVK